MIKVHLKAGDVVEIPKGKGGIYRRVTEEKKVSETEVVVTELLIKDSDSSYSGKVLASFQADEVLFYTVGDEDEGENNGGS